MTIRSTQHYTTEWTAVDDATYDGPGSPIGCGSSEQEAIEDLLDKLEDIADTLTVLQHHAAIAAGTEPEPLTIEEVEDMITSEMEAYNIRPPARFPQLAILKDQEWKTMQYIAQPQKSACSLGTERNSAGRTD